MSATPKNETFEEQPRSDRALNVNIQADASPCDGVALFSGGLDSVLAAKLLQEQGLRIRCLHFVTPFFGKPAMVPHWEKVYGLTIESVDVGEAYVKLLQQRPRYGFGKVMNPCVDCKILMMREAHAIMERLGGTFIASGEVLGQRPMSQRRDTLNVIRRDGDVKDLLLRPLCAQHLEPTAVELSGLVDRSKMLGLFGRGRKGQMELAARMGLREIPSPAGGCKLAEKENARRYWPVLTRIEHPTPADFELSNVGRQAWAETCWLSMGRNVEDNERLLQLFTPEDTLIKLADMPGPLGVVRWVGAEPQNEQRTAFLAAAAGLVASYSPRAVRDEKAVNVRLTQGDEAWVISVMANREAGCEAGICFEEPAFLEVREAIHQCNKDLQVQRTGLAT